MHAVVSSWRVTMGVLIDYFRAPDAASVVRVLKQTDGASPLGTEPSVFDGVEAKGVDPTVVLAMLIAAIRQVAWQVDLVEETTVWPASPVPGPEDTEDEASRGQPLADGTVGVRTTSSGTGHPGGSARPRRAGHHCRMGTSGGTARSARRRHATRSRGTHPARQAGSRSRRAALLLAMPVRRSGCLSTACPCPHTASATAGATRPKGTRPQPS